MLDYFMLALAAFIIAAYLYIAIEHIIKSSFDSFLLLVSLGLAILFIAFPSQFVAHHVDLVRGFGFLGWGLGAMLGGFCCKHIYLVEQRY